MIKLVMLGLCSFAFVANSYAQIRAYDPATGKEMELETLVDQGLIRAVDNTKAHIEKKYNVQTKSTASKVDVDESRYESVYKTDSEKRAEAQKELMSLMNEVPDSKKPIEEQKLTNLGRLIVFTTIRDFDGKSADVMDDIVEIKELESVFYLKEFKNQMSLMAMTNELNRDIAASLKLDGQNKNARRLGITKYQTMVYIAPDGSKATYAFSAGGLTALKIKLGEIKEILAKQQAN